MHETDTTTTLAVKRIFQLSLLLSVNNKRVFSSCTPLHAINLNHVRTTTTVFFIMIIIRYIKLCRYFYTKIPITYCILEKYSKCLNAISNCKIYNLQYIQIQNSKSLFSLLFYFFRLCPCGVFFDRTCLLWYIMQWL